MADAEAIVPPRPALPPAAVYGVYALFAFLPVLPLLLHPGSSPFFYPRADIGTTFWNWWWFDRTFWSGRNPLHTDMLFVPFGAPLYLHTFELVDALMFAPVRALGGLFAAWAVAVGAHSLWTAIAARMLAIRLGVGAIGAAIVGLLAMTATYRSVTVTAISLAATGHALWLAWAVAGCWREPGKLRHGAWLGAACSVLLFSNLNYLFFATFILGVTGAAMFLRARPSRAAMVGWGKQLALAAIVGALPLAFIVAGIAQSQQHLGAVAGYEEWVKVRASADAMQFVAPVWLRALLTGMEAPPRAHELILAPLRSISFAPPLAIIALALYGRRLGRRGEGTVAAPPLARGVRFALLVAAGTALLLALGPRVKVWTVADPADVPMDQVRRGEVQQWRGVSIPSPYTLIDDAPVLRQVRGMFRAGYFFQIALLLLLAPACERALRGLVERRLPPLALGAALLASVFVENRVEFYNAEKLLDHRGLEKLRDDPRPGAVREFPDIGFYVHGMAMYRQTVHHRPLIGGYLSRDLPGYDRWIEARAWRRWLYDAASIKAELPMTDAERRQFFEHAREDGIRFIIVNPYLYDPARVAMLEEFLQRHRLATLYAGGEDLRIWELAVD